MSRPIALLLVGLPGSGKSTYRKNLSSSMVFEVASSDDYLDRKAEELGLTYNEVFKEFIKEADGYFREKLMLAATRHEEIIIDRTNMSVKSRAASINILRKTHYIAAIVFNISDEDLYINLYARPGKNIPYNIIEGMKHSFVMPTCSEGIDYIETVNFTRN